MLDDIRSKAQSWGVKVIFGIIIVVFVFWGVGNMGGTSAGSLAVVNGENVSPRDYVRTLRAYEAQELKRTPDLLTNAEKFNEFKRAILNEMIMGKLRLQEARRLGLVVTPHELKTVIAALPVFQDASGKFDPELYKRILSAQNVNPGEYEASLAEDILDEKLMRYVGMGAGISEAETEKLFTFSLEKRFADYVLFSPAEYRTKVELSEEDITRYYDTHKESFRLPARAKIEYLKLTPETLAGGYDVSDEEAGEYYTKNITKYQNPESFQSRHIFIPAPPEGSTEPGAEKAIADAKATIDEVLAKLKAGGDFGDLARAYSQDAESAQIGGMLNWLSVGQTGSKEFDAAALALKPGQVSAPVRSGYGFHIIRLEDKKPAHTTPFDEVKPDIKAELAKGKADADFEAVQKAADDGLAMNTPFAELAKKFHVNVEETAMVSQNELEKKLALHSDSRQNFVDAIASVAASGAPSAIPVPLNTSDGLCLIRIAEAKASEIPPMGGVRERIIADLQTDRSRLLARTAAEEALPSFTGQDVPAAYKGKVTQSAAVIRVFPGVEPLGTVPDLVDALFSSSGAWLPQVYETPQGPVIARLAKTEPVSKEDWEQRKGIYIAQNKQYWENEARAAFMENLLAAAKIEISQQILDSVSAR